MVIIETSIFTRQVLSLLPDDSYRLLQAALLVNPEAGDIIPGSGGLRKMRWSLDGRGKRGGSRIIYYWAVSQDQVLMLAIYAKNAQVDLTSTQIKILRGIIEEQYP